MSRLGLNPRAKDLSEFRAFYASKTPEEYTDMVFEKAGVACVYMTNDPLDDTEGAMWQRGVNIDPRFKAVLRLDSALMNWPAPADKLRGLGYGVEEKLSDKTFAELRRYLADWVKKMDARYMAISLPPRFRISIRRQHRPYDGQRRVSHGAGTRDSLGDDDRGDAAGQSRAQRRGR